MTKHDGQTVTQFLGPGANEPFASARVPNQKVTAPVHLNRYYHASSKQTSSFTGAKTLGNSNQVANLRSKRATNTAQQMNSSRGGFRGAAQNTQSNQDNSFRATVAALETSNVDAANINATQV